MASTTEKPQEQDGRRPQFTDPLGRPIYQGNPRFTDQQAGGDLTGDERDARDDNYLDSASSQTARDVSAHAPELPAASAELQRYLLVASAPGGNTDSTDSPDSAASTPVEPDGTEDPGANADDGLMPAKKDDTAAGK